MTKENFIECVVRESAKSCLQALSNEEAIILLNIASQTIKGLCSVYLFRDGEKCVFPDNVITNAWPLSATEIKNLFSYHLVADDPSGKGCVITSKALTIITKVWQENATQESENG